MLIDDLFLKFIYATKEVEFQSFWLGLKGSGDKKSILIPLGKKIESELGKTASYKDPEVVAIIDCATFNINLFIKPIFVYGRYLKLVRGIP
ncbi:MAG: hypothetical protein QXL16_03065, partial [Candidatus Micrarchaeaceae archaeon]